MSKIDGEQLKTAIIATQEAFETVRLMTEDFIRHRIKTRVPDSEIDGDLIVEKVFQQVGRALTSYDKERAENPFAWFMTVVDHRIIDYCRAQKMPVVSLDECRVDDEGEEKEPTEPADRSSLSMDAQHERLGVRAALIEAVSRLSPTRREMFYLVSLFPELTYKEIVKVTGQVSVNAAKELKSRTMKELREHLTALGYDPSVFRELLRSD